MNSPTLPREISILALIFILPIYLPFLDCLRVVFGLPFMSLFAVTICLFIWLARIFVTHRVFIQPSPVYAYILLMGAIVFLSTTSPIGAPFGKLYRAASFSYTRLLMVLLLVNLIRSLDRVRRTMYIIIALGGISALIALWQFWMYQYTGENYSFAGPEDMFRVTPAGTFLRATALASLPNEIGSIMNVAGVWCLSLAIAGEERGHFAKAAHYLLFLILVGGVIVTGSRSSLVSLFVTVALLCVVTPFLSRRAERLNLAWAVGVLLAVGAGSALLFPTMFEEASGDVLWRLELNRLGARAVVEHPLTGVGIDAFSAFDNAYDLAVHNMFIQVAAELGAFGIIVFLAITAYLLIRLTKLSWTVRDSSSRSVLVAVTLGFVAKLIFHMSNPVLTDSFFWFSIGLSEAMVSAVQVDNGQGRAVDDV